MNATPIVASAAVLVGMTAGPALPVSPESHAPPAAAAAAEPLLKAKCRKAFRSDWRRVSFEDWAHAYDYYEGRRTSEQAMYDQLRWLIADPSAHDLIPGLEAAAARDRAEYQPIVAAQRDEYLGDVRTFQSTYLRNKCLSKQGRQVFTSGVRALRASFRDIYKAHEYLFATNLAVQTAQADVAAQSLQDADLEAATIEETWKRAQDRFRELRHSGR